MINIIIFGCSKMADRIEGIAREIEDINIIAYTDNNGSKWGTLYYGRTVIPVEEAVQISRREEAVIVIGSTACEAIGIQLDKMGITGYKLNIDDFLMEYQNELPRNSGQYIDPRYMPALSEDEDADILMISVSGLPKQEHLYRNGFVFRRLAAYKQAGLKMDAFGYVKGADACRYSYEGIALYEGNGFALLEMCRRKKYRKILVHFMNESVYFILKKAYGNKLPEIIVWAHGADVLRWDRRRFNYSEERIAKENELLNSQSEEKMVFWRELFHQTGFSFIFVSKWLLETVCHDVGAYPDRRYIIPNYIDEELFSYVPKTPKMRKKILLIKSHQTPMYATDVAQRTILLLSEQPYFQELQFELYGDGILFEQHFKELLIRRFPNVNIYRQYIPQTEIVERHRENGIFLCPTRQDTHGVSMCEAMSSGLVVVTNDVAAIPEYMDGSAGKLCGYEDAAGMAEAIRELYEAPGEFMRLSQAAAEKVRSQCGYEKTIRKEVALIVANGK